jgi:hypothetical protein
LPPATLRRRRISPQASRRPCKPIAGSDLGYEHHYRSVFPACADRLLVSFDPPGIAVLFTPPAERTRQAKRPCTIAFFIPSIFVVAGERQEGSRPRDSPRESWSRHKGRITTAPPQPSVELMTHRRCGRNPDTMSHSSRSWEWSRESDMMRPQSCWRLCWPLHQPTPSCDPLRPPQPGMPLCYRRALASRRRSGSVF